MDDLDDLLENLEGGDSDDLDDLAADFGLGSKSSVPRNNQSNKIGGSMQGMNSNWEGTASA